MKVKYVVCAGSFGLLMLLAHSGSAQTVVTHVDANGFTSVEPVAGVNGVDPMALLPRETGETVVGISSRDGITYSAPDVLITRNGITRRLTRELNLANGTRVFPNGTVILAGGSKVNIRPEQVLSFSGTFDDAPIAEAVIDETDAMSQVAERAVNGTRARRASRLLTK